MSRAAVSLKIKLKEREKEIIMKGKAFKFGDNISTDHIAPGRLFHLRSNLPEFAKHVLEDADPEFAKKCKRVILLWQVQISA